MALAKRIFLSPPHMNGTEMQYIDRAFETNWVAPLGANVDEFEQRMEAYLGAGHMVALSSGTAALHLAVRQAGVQPGDVVFCSDVTFIGSCNSVVYQGAELVFIDSDESWNMDPRSLKRALEDAAAQGRLPKAVIVVDLYGLPANYDEIVPLCREYGVPIIEDAAEALGSEYNGVKCGLFGETAALSFNSNKIITTSGGGMLITNTEQAKEKAKFWATQAKEAVPYYLHKEIGYNYRLSNISAGIGCGQMNSLPQYVEKRREIYDTYCKGLQGLPVRFYPTCEKARPNCWLTVMLLEDTDITPEQVIQALEHENIESRRFWNPMHVQPLFRENRFYTEYPDHPMGERLFERGVCLPSGTAMDEEQQAAVIQTIIKLFEGRG